MAGGASSSNNATPTSQILQNFQNPQGAGSAQTFGAGTQPTAQSVSQLQQVLQKLGAPGGGVGGMGQSPAMQLANTGMGMARMGQQPMPQMAPQAHPMGAPAPFAGAQTPQMPMMTGGMGMGGLPWQLLAQRGMTFGGR